jgi:CheY-like chemotaxis protein/HPt (histidine-containing phosphotransfer) domain-containing protein
MEKNETDPSFRKTQRILLAEDYEVNQKIGQLFLQNAGYRVDIAANGQLAVEAYQQNRYDLILMDIQMPIMDGYEATKRIRKWEKKLKAEKELQNQGSKLSGNNSDPNSAFPIPTSDFQRVPIIAMTGTFSEAGMEAENYPGINEYIRKPAKWDQVLLVVQKWIDAEYSFSMDNTSKGWVSPSDRGSKENPSPLNMDKAIEEFMGQKEMLCGILQDFVNIAGAQIENICRAVACSDYRAIGSEAHAIKGAAANLTADKLARLAADLEQAAEKQQPDLSAELADKLEQEFDDLKNYIQHIL